jgi:glycerophosphoryl diester phosphodiesterase
MSFTVPAVIGHRGARNEAPENTIESIAAALSLPGISGVEFDVERTDLPVVLHQETMVPNDDRTALVPATRDFVSRDWVSEMPARDVAYSQNFGTENQNVRQFSELLIISAAF